MITRIAPDLPLYRLTVPTPFPVGPVNLYLITEPAPVLIDTGPGMEESLQLLEKLLKEAGTEISRLRQILLTHAHQDHCGLAVQIAEHSGARIYAHPRERYHLSYDPKLREFYRAQMEQAGVPAEIQRQIAEHFGSVQSLSEPITDFRSLQDLREVRCGPAAFRPIFTPGHTPGSMSLWEPERRILLSADTVIRHITPNPILDLDESSPNMRFRSLGAMLDTLDRIRALNPAVIHTGHGEPVVDFAEHHDRLLEHHERRRGNIRNCLESGPHTVYEMAFCLFPDAGRYNSFLAISEIYAHLDLMEEAAEVRREMRDRVAVYSLL